MPVVRYGSREALTIGVEALWSDCTVLIDTIGGFVTSITWNLDRVILNHILLDDCLAGAKRARLVNCMRIEVSLGDESIVAGNVRCRLGRAHRQLMMLVACSGRISGKFIAWVVTVNAYRFLELSLVVASLGGVGLAWVRPDGALRNRDRCSHLRIIGVEVVRLPMFCGVTRVENFSLLHHLLSFGHIITSPTSVGKKLWVVHQIVLDQIVGVLRRHFIVAWLDRCCYLLAILRAKAIVIGEAFGTIS